MNSLKDLRKKAEFLIGEINNGKTYTTKYVLNRLEKTASELPGDILVSTMRDVYRDKLIKDNFTTQKEVAYVYNKLLNFSGGKSDFRDHLGDLLPPKYAAPKELTKDASGSRGSMDSPLKPLYTENEEIKKMAQEFAGVFSLAPKGSFSPNSDNTIKKAEKFAAAQLKSIGCPPRAIRTIRSNDHFVLCVASYNTNNFSEVSVSVPVQTSNGIPYMPSHFVDGDNLVLLNQKNLLVYLKESSDNKISKANSSFKEQRRIDSLSLDGMVKPSGYNKYVELEDALVSAATKFDQNQIKLALSILSTELLANGIPNPQIKIGSSDDRGIMFKLSMQTTNGKEELEIPVEFSQGRPLYPDCFIYNDKKYGFNKRNLYKIALSNKKNSSYIADNGDIDNMSYHQLLNVIIDGTSSGDYKMAENALSIIQSKYSGQQVINALNKYSGALRDCSENKERDRLIKSAVSKGDLISVKTSLDLYSPKYGLPLSKLTFDAHGNLIPKRRSAKFKNQDESSVMGISSYKINLT